MIFLKFKIRFLILTLLKSRIWFWIFTYCRINSQILDYKTMKINNEFLDYYPLHDRNICKWYRPPNKITNLIIDFKFSKSKKWFWNLWVQNPKSDFIFRFWGGGRLHHFHIYSNDIWLSKSKIWFCILYFQNQKTDFGIYKFRIQNLILFLDFEGGWASASLSYIL